jgi:hypothetical protein
MFRHAEAGAGGSARCQTARTAGTSLSCMLEAGYHGFDIEIVQFADDVLRRFVIRYDFVDLGRGQP